LNHRLGTKGLDIAGIAAEAAKRNQSVEDLMSIVEQEGWLYEGLENDGRAYVCSAYVAAVYQAAGIFAPGKINGPEFTPKDVYTLNIFDLNFHRPSQCVAADPNQPFCQLLGKYRMTFPGYSTINPYDHMAETCPTIAPTYERPSTC
jgi:hypothetical protein